jgi:hypothetical protein
MKRSSCSERLETIVLENALRRSVCVNLTSRRWFETTYYKKCVRARARAHTHTHILLGTNLNHLLCDNLAQSIFTDKVWPHINDYFSTGL